EKNEIYLLRIERENKIIGEMQFEKRMETFRIGSFFNGTSRANSSSRRIYLSLIHI
ncbi:hypothetical protein A5842_002444, partial [Enterococcus faecium]